MTWYSDTITLYDISFNILMYCDIYPHPVYGTATFLHSFVRYLLRLDEHFQPKIWYSVWVRRYQESRWLTRKTLFRASEETHVQLYIHQLRTYALHDNVFFIQRFQKFQSRLCFTPMCFNILSITLLSLIMELNPHSWHLQKSEISKWKMQIYLFCRAAESNWKL